MYKKVSTDMNFVEREKQVEKFWEDNQIFEKSMKVREGNPSYVFYDGPPTANGKPHIGHVETRVIKDMIPRYRTMKGYQVPRRKVPVLDEGHDKGPDQGLPPALLQTESPTRH